MIASKTPLTPALSGNLAKASLRGERQSEGVFCRTEAIIRIWY